MRIFVLAFSLFIVQPALFSQTQDPWIIYNTPSEVHNMLGKYNGDFVLDVSMWMDTSTTPVVFNLLAVNRMILEGRFLEIAQSGNMGNEVYKGLTTIGYNTSSKEYDLITITNMGTGILTLTGKGEDLKTANLTGEIFDPVKKKPIKVRQKISFIDPNNLLIENFDTYDGKKEKKTVEYRFKRK